MSSVCQPQKCIGCGACAAKCPKQCITIGYDAQDGLKAEINDSQCVNCNICKDTCPNEHFHVNFYTPKSVLAAYSSNSQETAKSTSGGIAYELAKVFIANGGFVYACVFFNGTFIHKRITDCSELSLLQGSKYVQSIVSKEVYRQIKTDLKNGGKVLFIGTPCQVVGVKAYLKTKATNHKGTLYSVDLICHGTPSPKMLSNYLHYKGIDEKLITNIVFREKQHYVFKVFSSDGLMIDESIRTSSYVQAFLHNIFLNEACYHCQYTKYARVSDLTLGDFWGYEGDLPAYGKAISMVLVNTQEGDDLVKSVSASCIVEYKGQTDVAKSQKHLNEPARKTILMKMFSSLYPICGFSAALRISVFPHTVKNVLLSVLGK